MKYTFRARQLHREIINSNVSGLHNHEGASH